MGNSQYKLLKSWDSANLQDSINKYLAIGWQLHGDTFTYMEERNHATSNIEYRAPMFCQAVILTPKNGTNK